MVVVVAHYRGPTCFHLPPSIAFALGTGLEADEEASEVKREMLEFTAARGTICLGGYRPMLANTHACPCGKEMLTANHSD